MGDRLCWISGDEAVSDGWQVFPHGSTDSLPYATMGSGSLNAMAVFEASYEEDLSKDAAISLVARAIRSGIFNDLGSGSNVDICVITKDGVEYKRNYEYLMGKTYARKKPVTYGRGSSSKPQSELAVMQCHFSDECATICTEMKDVLTSCSHLLICHYAKMQPCTLRRMNVYKPATLLSLAVPLQFPCTSGRQPGSGLEMK